MNMQNTIIKELLIKGIVKDEDLSKENQELSNTSGISTEERESIIQECLRRMKEYLKYEYER